MAMTSPSAPIGRAIGAIALMAVCGAACQRDYRFDTIAEYEMPRAGCRVSVHASGRVNAGDDLSRQSAAEVTIAPPSPSQSPVRLTATLPGMPLDRASLGRLLADLACDASAEEIAEIQRSVDGALAGPKATLMAGQTHVLRVVGVRFQRP
jgi:hypothetical protein